MGTLREKLRRIIRQKEEEEFRRKEERKEQIRAYIELQEHKKHISEYCRKLLEPMQKNLCIQNSVSFVL